MSTRKAISYNPYFIIPFLVWVIGGGILLTLFTKEQLFFAINSHYTPATDVIMYYVTWLGEGWFIAILLLLMFGISRFRNLWFIITATLCALVPLAVQQSLKAYFNAPRPRLYFKDLSVLHYLPQWPGLIHNSFPSGHSEGAFAYFCFISLLLPEKYRKAGLLFFLAAMCVGYSRIYLTAHFFADVYAGSIIGVVTTIVVYSLMYRLKDKWGKQPIDDADNA